MAVISSGESTSGGSRRFGLRFCFRGRGFRPLEVRCVLMAASPFFHAIRSLLTASCAFRTKRDWNGFRTTSEGDSDQGMFAVILGEIANEFFTGPKTDDLLRAFKQWQAREERKDLMGVTERLNGRLWQRVHIISLSRTYRRRYR